MFHCETSCWFQFCFARFDFWFNFGSIMVPIGGRFGFNLAFLWSFVLFRFFILLWSFRIHFGFMLILFWCHFDVVVWLHVDFILAYIIHLCSVHLGSFLFLFGFILIP